MSIADRSRDAASNVREGLYTVFSMVTGHIVTLVNLFRPKVTLQYPEVRYELPPGYRGLPVLPVDPATGMDLCIGCGACARVCPTQLITVEAHMGEDKKRVVDAFVMRMELCMFCGLCADACPVNAIVMSNHYELATFSRDELVLDRAKLNELGGFREGEEKAEDSEPAAQTGPE